MNALLAAEATLLAPGAPFETEDAVVLGQPMRVFRNRARSLRAILEASRAFGGAEHLVFVGPDGERRLTFEEHARWVARVASALAARGVRKGDRVAVLAANCPEWIVTFWATVSLGAVCVGLNAWWANEELAYALADAAPRVLVVDAKRLARLGGPPPGIACVGIEESFAELSREAPPGEALPEVAIEEDDPAVILYTSGTTGRSKGAVHTHRNVIALLGAHFFHGARLRTAFPPPPGSLPNTILVTSPLFHVSGLHSAAISALAAGIKSVWMTGRFDAGLALRLIEEHRVTGWGFTSALLHRLLFHPDTATRDLSSVRQLGGGGSPIAPRLQVRAREVFPSIGRTLGVGYGLTECTALATLNTGDELRDHPESVGRPMPTVDLEVRGEDGAPLADGEEGEVCVRSPLVMLGYFRNHEATRASIDARRWLRTGDLGCIRDGRLYLSSRRQDLILRGGENVYPAEIEQCLEACPGVAEVAVVGVDHAELGQEVKAIVVPAPGARLAPADLTAWTKTRLAYFKVPAHWEIRDEPLPRNAVGKVVKRLLGEPG